MQILIIRQDKDYVGSFAMLSGCTLQELAEGDLRVSSVPVKALYDGQGGTQDGPPRADEFQ